MRVLGSWEGFPVDPGALAAGYLPRTGWARSARSDAELDEMWSDALWGIICARRSWRPENGSFVPLAWTTMGREVARGWRRRGRAMSVLGPAPFADNDEGWQRAAAWHEPGYGQVDARDEAQRLADWTGRVAAPFTPAELAAVRWYAVHGGTIVRSHGGEQAVFPDKPSVNAFKGARIKFRAGAASLREYWQHRQEGAAA